MPQDGIGGAAMEIEIRKDKGQKIGLAREYHFFLTQFHGDLALFAPVDLGGFEGLDKINGLGDPGL